MQTHRKHQVLESRSQTLFGTALERNSVSRVSRRETRISYGNVNSSGHFPARTLLGRIRNDNYSCLVLSGTLRSG